MKRSGRSPSVMNERADLLVLDVVESLKWYITGITQSDNEAVSFIR